MYCLPGKAWALGHSYPGTSSRVTYAPLMASSRRSSQTQWSFSTQRRRCYRDSLLRVLRASVVIPLDFFPGHPRSARGIFQTLLSNSGGSFQHRVAEESEILLSGFSVPLWLYPRTSSQNTHAPLVESSRRSCRRR